MNQDTNPLDLVTRDLSQSTTPAIVLTSTPSLDAVYAALTLYMGLIKLGKTPSIVAPSKLSYNIKEGAKIGTQLGSGGDNLVISFPYTDGSIDKVDYRIENNTFNLIVIPRPGYPKVTPEQVSYSFAGGNADCLIAIAGKSPESFGRLFQENQQLFAELPLVVIDNNNATSAYGSSSFIDPSAVALSQLALDILTALQVPLDEEIATPALNGIIAATNNFTSPRTDVSVFEQVAELMRLGATRENVQQPPRPTAAAPQQFSRQKQGPREQQRNEQGGQRPKGQGQGQQRSFNRPPQQPPPQQQAAPAPTQPSSWADTLPAAEPSTQNPSVPEEASSNPQEDKNAPQDWLKPKIFKGNGFI